MPPIGITWLAILQLIVLVVEAQYRPGLLRSHLSRLRERQYLSRNSPVKVQIPAPTEVHDRGSRQRVTSGIAKDVPPEKIRQSVIIAGIAKNVSPGNTRRLIPQLVKLGEAFDDYHIVVYENDSPPDSRAAFKEELAKTRHSTFIYEDNVARIGSRTDIIARARNVLAQFVYSHFNKTFNYIIVTDLDGDCSQSFNIPAFKRLLARSDEWDVVSFNSIPYWDLWAFRDKDHMPYNHWGSQAHKNKVHKSQDMDAWLATVPRDDLIPIDSGFMMITMYKMHTWEGTKYSGVGVYGEMDCEHVAFHRDMAQRHNARIRLTTYERCMD